MLGIDGKPMYDEKEAKKTFGAVTEAGKAVSVTITLELIPVEWLNNALQQGSFVVRDGIISTVGVMSFVDNIWWRNKAGKLECPPLYEGVSYDVLLSQLSRYANKA